MKFPDRRILLHLLIFVAGLWAPVAFSPRSPAQTVGRMTLPSFAEHCDFCLASQGISPLEAGSSGMRIDFRYLSLGTLYRDGVKAENTERELETHLTEQFSFLWSTSRDFTIAALLPVPKRHSEQVREDGTVVTGNQFGPGDISFLGRYKIITHHDMETSLAVSVNGGVKLPTGATNGKDNQGEYLDPHIQLGTGSTDFLAGASAFAAFDEFTVIGNLLGSLTTQGTRGHRFGNSLNYDVSMRYRLYPEDYDFPQLFLTFGVFGEYRARELFAGVPDPNSGGHIVYLAPGGQVFLAPSFTLEFSYQPAVLHHLYGRQLGEDYRIMSGILFLF